MPGLVKYCVYPSPTTLPTSHTVTATGANGAHWVYATGSNNFAFVRPGGDKTNIPLDGNDHDDGHRDLEHGSGQPDHHPPHQRPHDVRQPVRQRHLGHLLRQAEPPTGPICDKGDTTVAYNAMPFDVVNCLNPGVAFEANEWNEFGDSVTLSGTGRTLKSLIVDFQSFACVTGTWDNQGGNNPCGGGTTPGVSPGTFTWPITANIYAADANGLPTGSPLATTDPSTSRYLSGLTRTRQTAPRHRRSGSTRWLLAAGRARTRSRRSSPSTSRVKRDASG